MTNESNSAKGRNSFDVQSGNNLITFFNRNVSPYPTEVGGPKFDLVPVTKQKDVMINVARLHAQQEYDRIMDLATVLQKQAAQIKRRLEITDAVHAAKYDFQLYHGKCYWLIYDKYKNCTRLSHHGPHDTLVKDNYEFLAKVKWLGDYTWIEVDGEENPVN